MNLPLFLTHLAEWLGVVAVAWFLARIPRFTARKIGFKYPRRDGIMALVIAATAVIFAFVFTTPQLKDLPPRLFPAQGLASELVPRFFIAAVCLLLIVIAALMRGQPLRSAGWDRAGLRAGLQSGLALAMLTILLRNRALDLINGIEPAQVTYLLFALGIAIAEETVFRGYIQLRLTWWLGETRGWFITALFYAAFRFPILLAAGNLEQALFGLLIVLGQGLITGYLMRKSGSVLAPILYHATSIWMDSFI